MGSIDTYDYIVIGSGVAGCVVASRLKQYHPGLTIVLVEAGPDASSDDRVRISARLGELDGTPLKVQYETVPQKHMDNLSIPNSAGRMLSGSSGVNYGNWARGHKNDYDLWEKHSGDARWSYDGLLPYMKKVEKWYTGAGDREHHGFDGPMKTQGPRTYPLSSAFTDAFSELNVPLNSNFSDGNPTGVGSVVENFIDGIRQPAASVYDLSGVKILTETPVHRVVFDDNSKAAIGVKLISGNIIHSRKEVILSAGATVTPQILMLSGIGPSDVLKDHDIPEIVVNEDVGHNYFNHLALIQAWKVKHPEKNLVMNLADLRPEYLLGLMAEHIYTHQHPSDELRATLESENLLAADKAHLLGGSAQTGTHPIYAPLGLHPAYYNIPIDGTHLCTVTTHYLPTSRGRVTLKSTNPTDHPLVDPQYCSTASDRLMFRSAIRRTCALFETSALSAEISGETPPNGWKALTSHSSDEDIDARIRRFSMVIHHPTGTASVGKVVDAEFRVKGVKGLRVVDASVMPSPIGATPQATVYALGEMAGDFIARDVR